MRVNTVDGQPIRTTDRVSYLSLLPVQILRLTARLFYRPRQIRALDGWIIGATENNLSGYRQKLRNIWNALILKESEKATLAVRWYKNTKLMIYQDNEISRAVFIEGLYEPNLFHNI